MSDLSTPLGEVPGVGRPAARALAEHGLTTLGELAGQDWDTLARLHGVGPAAGRRLHAALEELGEHLVNPPAASTRTATFTRGGTGVSAPDIVTHATEVDPAGYVASLEGRRRREGEELLTLYREVTGEQATMWGPSMIGYGQYHYVYATGREGDSFRVGFSPRTAELALYGLQGPPEVDELLDRLGKHRRGAACLWVRKLEDIDVAVLRELVARAWAGDPGAC
jgi:Helix-hairpin-helix domain/Domain of unknown function (DU1801)